MGPDLFGDLRSPRLIVAKGWLFLFLGLFAWIGNLVLDALWQRGLVSLVAIWAFCRFYYFIFYVLEKYVDPERRYSGLGALLGAWFKGGGTGPEDSRKSG